MLRCHFPSIAACWVDTDNKDEFSNNSGGDLNDSCYRTLCQEIWGGNCSSRSPLVFWRESQWRSNLTEQTWAPPEGFLIKVCSERPPVSQWWNQSSPPRAPVPKSKVLSLPSISKGVSDSPLSGIWCLCTFLWASRPLFACSRVLACTRLTLGSANLALQSNVDINHLRTTN